MNKMVLALTVALLGNCGPLNLKDPVQSATIASIGTKTVDTIIDKTKDIVEVEQKLTLPSIEVCHKIKGKKLFRCVLTKCPLEDDECYHYVSEEYMNSLIEDEQVVIISLKEWSQFLSYVKYYCSVAECKDLYGQGSSFYDKQVILDK